MSHHKATIPQVLYNTPDPFTEPSELYKIIAEVLPSATDPIKCWLVTEEHGYWNEATKSFENRANTLKPEDPIHWVSLAEAFKAIEAQVMLRLRAGGSAGRLEEGVLRALISPRFEVRLYSSLSASSSSPNSRSSSSSNSIRSIADS